MSGKDAAPERNHKPQHKKPVDEPESAEDERWSHSDNWVCKYFMVTDKHGIKLRRFMHAENTYPEERVWVLPVYSDDEDSEGSDVSPKYHKSTKTEQSAEGSKSDDSDNGPALSRGDAADGDSEEETSTRVMRRRQEKNYSESIDTDKLQNNDQNRLAVALEHLKKECFAMGQGLSEADMHAKVM